MSESITIADLSPGDTAEISGVDLRDNAGHAALRGATLSIAHQRALGASAR